MNNVLKFHKTSGFKERLPKKWAFCFQAFPSLTKSLMKIWLKPVWTSWMVNGCPKPLRLKAKIMSPPAPLISPNDNVSSKAAWTRPSCHWRNRIKVPTCYIPKVSANIRLQDGILNGKAVLFGVWVFLSPQYLELFWANSFQTTAYEVVSWKPIFNFVRECDHIEKEGKKREKLVYDFEGSSTDWRELVGPLSVHVCIAHLRSNKAIFTLAL